MLKTDDLFLAALGLVRGGELQGTEIRGTNGRRLAVFLIAGDGMPAVEHDYYGGALLVNLRLFKSEVARLKNVAFEALREEERKGHAGHEGRDRTDQGCQRAWGRPR